MFCVTCHPLIDSCSRPSPQCRCRFEKGAAAKAARADARPTLDRLPPHALDMEQSGVLGCQLLSPNECVAEVIEKLKGVGIEAHYDLRHQTIQAELFEMPDQRVPIELVTVMQRLKDKQLLEQIGGIAYLRRSCRIQCQARRILSYYLEIVQAQKTALRRMIATCTDVVGRVYDYEGDVETLPMDDVEKEILRINESRAQTGNGPGDDKGTGGQGDLDGGKLFQPQGRVERHRNGLPGFGPDDGRFARQRNDCDRGAAFDGQNVAGDEHRGARGAGAKFAGRSFLAGNVGGILGAADDVFDCAREFAEHPRRIYERIRFSKIDERGGAGWRRRNC